LRTLVDENMLQHDKEGYWRLPRTML